MPWNHNGCPNLCLELNTALMDRLVKTVKPYNSFLIKYSPRSTSSVTFCLNAILMVVRIIPLMVVSTTGITKRITKYRRGKSQSSSTLIQYPLKSISSHEVYIFLLNFFFAESNFLIKESTIKATHRCWSHNSSKINIHSRIQQ